MTTSGDELERAKRYPCPVTLIVEFDREEDGRWIADIDAIPGCLVYGKTREEALAKVEALALRVLADRLEHGEAMPEPHVSFVVPEAA
jgi:predicted RNase H-like HicB family nuclease